VYSNQGKLQVRLTVAASQFTFGGQASTFCLDANDATVCSVPGPSLFVKPGDEVNITIVSSSTSTNVTFALHGLGDGVKHSGGNSFVFTVPSDASPGTHWYRSPLSLQIMAGLHGALVVRPHDDNALSPAFEALTRRMCVFSHVMTGRNPPDGFFVWSAKPGKYEQSLTGVGSSTDVWLTNGVYQPVLVATSSVTILDVVVASGDRLLERYRATVLSGDSPGHLAVIHALRAGLFSLPPRVMEGSYLLQEGTGAGLDGRDVSKFLIGGVLGHVEAPSLGAVSVV
jgi:FtsP/CotA-like multicopper oxidase with cupredoxin domain